LKKSERARNKPVLVPETTPSLVWLPPAVAIIWGALALSLSRVVWPALWGIAGTMWDSWIAAPDFSWMEFIRALSGHLWGLATLALMLVASYGAGRPLIRLLGAGAGLSRIFLQMAFGWGVISLIQQGLGYPGLYFHGVFGAELLLLILLGVWALWHDRPWRDVAWADCRAVPPLKGEVSPSIWRADPPIKGEDSPVSPAKPADEAVWPRLLALVLILAAAYLLSRMPDTDEDARLYHLAGPESYLLIHKIFAVPGHFAWHMPFGAEMDFLVPFALGGITYAKQVNVAVLIVLLGLVWSLSSSLGRGSLWSAIWVGTAGLVLGQCWEGKNDFELAMYCTGSALCAVNAVKGSRRWLVPAACLAGLAVGVKLTAGLFCAGLFFGLLLYMKPRPSSKRWAIIFGLGLLPFIGWLGAAWLFLGNPFHPFLSGLFPDLGWGPFYSEWLNRQARSISPAEALMKRDWLLGIWRGLGSYDHGSVALFWILPLALLGRKSRESRLLAVCVLVMYLAWIPSHRNPRYLFPLIPLVAALASHGGGADGIFSGWSSRWRNILGAYCVVVALFLGIRWLAPSGYLYLLGQSSREDVLKAQFSSWEEMRNWVNRSVPAGGKLLLSGEERRLWFERRTVSNGPVFEPPFWKWTKESQTPEEMRKRIKQAGFTHMVHNFVSGQYRRLRWYPGPEWDDRQIKLYSGFASRYMAHTWRSTRMDSTNGGFHAFTFSRFPLARPAPLYFLPSTEGIFWNARQAIESGRMEDAMAESARVVARMPGVREGEYLRAAMVYSTRDNAQVWRLLEPGLREGFITSHNIAYAASSVFALGRIKEAIKLFALEARMMPGAEGEAGLAAALLARSQSAMAQKDFRRAWHDAEAAGYLAPQDARFRWAASNALMALGRYPEAARFLAEGRRLSGMGENPPASGVGSDASPRSMMGK